MKLTLRLVLLGAAAAVVAAFQPAGGAPGPLVVETVAGTGEPGFSGDGGAATEARLNEPSGVAIDEAGNVYIADNDNNRIRRVDPEGRITTIAGTGERGFSGDSGPATEARLDNPYGVWVSAAGEIYIADQRNHRVRRVSTDGVIETIAGNGISGYSGDGGPATEAALSFPDDVVRNSRGELFIADAGNDVVRRIRVDGTIDTYAGSGEHAYNGASDLSGDGGPAGLAQLDTPAALAIDRDDNLYIADLRNHAVRKVSPAGVITTVAGTGKPGFNGDRRDATRALLDEPGGVAIEEDGSLLIADGGNWRVRRLAPDGSITTIAGDGTEGFSGDGGDARLARFSTLDLLAVGPQGDIYVADYGNHAIRRLAPGSAEEAEGAVVERLLMRMRDAYAAVDQVQLETRERRRTADGWSERAGTVEYRGDSRIRARFSIPDYGQVAVESDGFKITISDPTRPGPEVMRHDANNLNRALLGNLEVYAFYDAFRQLSTAAGGFMSGSRLRVAPERSWAGRSWIVLEEEAGGLEIAYFVDPDSHLIWRTVQRDAGSGEVRYESYLAGAAGGAGAANERIVLDRDGWRLVGDWRRPDAEAPVPAVLLLHRAAGARAEYAELAEALRRRGIASLALDLRAHGESINRGRFEEPFPDHRHLLDGTHRDVDAALRWLAAQPEVAADRLAAVGASYSGEAIGEALRAFGRPARAYVMLSPGSFSDESIAAIDPSGAAWLFVRTEEEGEVSRPFIDAVFAAIAAGSRTAEARVLPGSGHATRIFDSHPPVIEEIADWLAPHLVAPGP